MANQTRITAALAAIVGLAGCLVSPNPFYDNGDIVTDDNLVGTYVDHQEDVYWKAIPSPAQAGRYEVLLADHGAISHFLGTLFKIGNGTYLDLKAIGAVAVYTGPVPSTSMPSMSQRIDQLLGDGTQHLVVRIAASKGDATYWMAAPDILKRLPKEELGAHPPPAFGSRASLDRPTKDLRALLRNYGMGDILFTEKKILHRFAPHPPEAPRADGS